MKKEELTALGITEEQSDQVFALHGKDLEKHKAAAESKASELSAANQTILDLQQAVKKFDGVDVEKLRGDLTALREKYDADISASKLDGALNLALAGVKAKNPGLAKKALDLSLLKLDGEKLLGLDEQLVRLRESDSYLFEQEGKAPGSLDSGGAHGSALGENLDKFTSAAMRGAGLKTE